MLSGDLLNHLRLRLRVMGLPTMLDELLLVYIDNAYKSFVAAMEGVPDEETLTVLATTTTIALPDYILKIKAAEDADGKDVMIVNRGDTKGTDLRKRMSLQGDISHLVIGTKPNIAHPAYIPEVDTELLLDIDRMPKVSVIDPTADLADVDDLYQLDLLDGAVAEVLKINPDPNLRAEAGEYEGRMLAKAAVARKAKARSKSKRTRVVRYNGL